MTDSDLFFSFLFLTTLFALRFAFKRRQRKMTAAEWLEGMRAFPTNPKFPTVKERHARPKE